MDTKSSIRSLITQNDIAIAKNLTRLFQLRKQTDKLTQPELAEKVDISQPMLSNILNAKRHLPRKLLIDLANALNAHPSEIDPNFKLVKNKIFETNREVFSLKGKKQAEKLVGPYNDSAYGIQLGSSYSPYLPDGIAVVDPHKQFCKGNWVCLKLKDTEGYTLNILKSINTKSLVPQKPKNLGANSAEREMFESCLKRIYPSGLKPIPLKKIAMVHRVVGIKL